MKRRAVMSLAGGVALSALPARALTPGRTYRIGWLGYATTNTAEGERIQLAVEHRFRELGLVEGGNLLTIRRYADGRIERYDDFAAEMVRLGVDLVIASSNAVALAVMRVSRAMPIVHVAAAEPVQAGLVASLARPGGQNTGIASLSGDLTPKRIELLKAAIPSAKRVAIARCPRCLMANGRTAAQVSAYLDAHDVAARAVGLTLLPLDLDSTADFDAASATLRRERPDALLFGPNPVNVALGSQWLALAASLRLPTIGWGGRQGGMLSYDADQAAIFRRAAEFVVRILDGARPGDLPMEQPTVFEFVIDLRIAKTLGLTIPQSVRLRATEVIE